MRFIHYKWLDHHLAKFFADVGTRFGADDAHGMTGAHGDKFYGYRMKWATAGIPFAHGVAIGLLSYTSPFSAESRETDAGWVPVDDWVIDNYQRFLPHLPAVDESDPRYCAQF